jgi:hypothetical protein
MRQILLFLVLIIPAKLFSQDTAIVKPKLTKDLTKWSVNVAVGPCFPFGDYGSRDLDNPRAGFSLVGLSTKLRVGYQVSKNLYVVSDAVWFYNPVDANTFLNSYTNSHPSSIFDSYKITTNAWNTYGLMFGVSKAFTFTDISLELKGMVGVVQGRYSNISVDQVDFDNDSTKTINYNGKNATQVAMDIGFNFKTKLSQAVGISVGGDYFGSEMHFKELSIEQSNGNNSDNGSYVQPISVFQLSAGFYITF